MPPAPTATKTVQTANDEVKQKGPGRPKGPAKPKDPNGPVVVRLKFTPEEYAKLTALAESDDRTSDNMIKVIIKRAMRTATKVAESQPLVIAE